MTPTLSNDELLDCARAHIPGGVNSPVRAFKAVGGTPVFIDRSDGASFVDSYARASEAADAGSSLPLNLNALGEVFRRQGRLAEAEGTYDRSIAIVEAEDPEDPWVALACAGRAAVRAELGRPQQAEGDYQRALRLMAAAWGTDDRDYRSTVEAYAALLRHAGRRGQVAEAVAVVVLHAGGAERLEIGRAACRARV